MKPKIFFLLLTVTTSSSLFGSSSPSDMLLTQVQLWAITQARLQTERKNTPVKLQSATRIFDHGGSITTLLPAGATMTLARQAKHRRELVLDLIKKKADPNILFTTNIGKVSPLQWLIKNGHSTFAAEISDLYKNNQ